MMNDGIGYAYTLAAAGNLGCGLAVLLATLSGNDFAGSVFAQRHLRLLRQRNGLMIYNKIVLVITKLIFNYYNTDFSLEITSKVQNVSQKYTFTQTDHQMQLSDAIFFFRSTVTEWNVEDCGISKAAKYTSRYRCVRLEVAPHRPIGGWHQSTARAIKKHMVPSAL